MYKYIDNLDIEKGTYRKVYIIDRLSLYNCVNKGCKHTSKLSNLKNNLGWTAKLTSFPKLVNKWVCNLAPITLTEWCHSVVYLYFSLIFMFNQICNGFCKIYFFPNLLLFEGAHACLAPHWLIVLIHLSILYAHSNRISYPYIKYITILSWIWEQCIWNYSSSSLPSNH